MNKRQLERLNRVIAETIPYSVLTQDEHDELFLLLDGPVGLSDFHLTWNRRKPAFRLHREIYELGAVLANVEPFDSLRLGQAYVGGEIYPFCWRESDLAEIEQLIEQIFPLNTEDVKQRFRERTMTEMELTRLNFYLWLTTKLRPSQEDLDRIYFFAVKHPRFGPELNRIKRQHGWPEDEHVLGRDHLNRIAIELIVGRISLLTLFAQRDEGVKDFRPGSLLLPSNISKLPYQIPDGIEDLEDLLNDNLGYADSFGTCDNCLRVFETQPSFYGWQPSFFPFRDGTTYCRQCISDQSAEEDVIEEMANRPRLLSTHIVDPEDFGWTRLDYRFESGLHHGQNADQKRIIALFQDQQPPIDILFTGLPGQFDIEFWAWARDEDAERAQELLDWTPKHNFDLPYDQATEFSKALRGEHSDHIKRVESPLPGGGQHITLTHTPHEED